jgi:hypothetical protein
VIDVFIKMKYVLIGTLFLMCLSFTACSAFSRLLNEKDEFEYTKDGFTFWIDYEGEDFAQCYVYVYNGTASDVVIPSEYKGVPITTIVNLTDGENEYVETVFIPSTIEIIYSFSGFSGFSNLTHINVCEDNPNFADIDGVVFSKDLTEILYYPKGRKDSEYTIPDSVTKIGHSAFDFPLHLLAVTIPASVTPQMGGEWDETDDFLIDESVLIYYNYFIFCNELKLIQVCEDNEYYTSIDGVLFSKDGKT